MGLQIVAVPHPGRPGTDPPRLLAGFVEASRRHLLSVLGDDDLADSAQSLTVAYADQSFRRTLLLVAVDSDQVLGGIWLTMPLRDNTTLAEAGVALDPGADPAEVLPLLWEHARPVLVADGRRTAQVWMTHAVHGAGEVMVPRTGAGRLSGDRAATTLRDLGFVLEQVERHSAVEMARALALAEDAGPRAADVAGTAYRAVSWVGSTPPEHLEAMAGLMARMSVDVPTGDLELEPEAWDAERVAHGDRKVEAMGRVRVTTVAQQVASGSLVAYTTIDVPTDKPHVAYQEDTLVHGEHRGHRLGMLVKAVNLGVLAAAAPQVARIHTWNAGENAHMLAINEALGFRERSVEGGWQLTALT
ncbi:MULTISPECIES: hypothetical protein [unclassified Ornithinimicrobium]|uniref:hypothetical protein n=1 Tax=unclassified Ornithinimicrobium TaxID=2615080 RepID=UPI003855122D